MARLLGTNVISFEVARRRRQRATWPDLPYHGEVLHFVEAGACVRCHLPVSKIPHSEIWTNDTYTYSHATEIGCRLCAGRETERK